VSAHPRGAAVRDGGLYVHVPFCAALCRYCHFPRTDRHDAALRRRLVDGILAEWRRRRARCAFLDPRRVRWRTAYVGGGTPSLLEPELAVRLADGLWGDWPGAPPEEITVEANPESFTPDVARAWRAAGVDRVSLGVQSLDPAVLARLGRRCTPEQAVAALRLAAAVFPRVSADWILAPGCRPAALAREFALARELGVGHVSFYVLELHPGTPLAADVAAGRVPAPGEAETEAAYLAGVAALARLGYRQYEVSNFALPGQESRHNAAYWTGRPYVGLGPGAHSFWGRRRAANLADPEAYLAALARGGLPEAAAEILTPAQRRLERLLLGLRTATGVPLDLLAGADAVLDAGEGELWVRRDGRLRLTPRGWLRLDAVTERLSRHLAGPGVD